jgi:hypothetical protein
MAACCDPHGCDRFFGARFAGRMAKRYRSRGLDKPARRMVAFLDARGIEGASVLEVGGGVGEIQLELLGRGAAHAVNLELSPAYEPEAARLLREAGVEERVERRLHDIAVDPTGVEPADVVVLHRVVCCYPDYERLLTAAADHARRLLVFSHPPRNVISRAIIAMQNLGLRLARREFRTFAHPPAAMLAVLEARGLRPAFVHHGLPWHVAGLERHVGEPLTAGERAAARIASAERSMSSLVVCQPTTDTRITARPRKVLPLSQHVPSRCTRSMTAFVISSSSEKRTSTWLSTTSLRTSTPSARSSRAAIRWARSQQPSTSAASPSRPSDRSAA